MVYKNLKLKYVPIIQPITPMIFDIFCNKKKVFIIKYVSLY